MSTKVKLTTTLTLKPGNNRRTLALMGSLCLFLSVIEYLIPKPLPFMRIGLANLPLLLALDMFGLKDFSLLVLIKILGQGIMGGTLFSYIFIFSLAGSCASAAVMYGFRLLWGKDRLGFAGLGCAGAMVSNGVQLLLARYFIFGPALRYVAPPFLASGLLSGIALGLIAEYFSRHSLWYRRYTHLVTGIEPVLPAPIFNLPRMESRAPRGRRWNEMFNANILCAAGLIMALTFLFSRSLQSRVIQFLFFCLLAWFSGKRNNVFMTIIVMAGIVFFNLLTPYGKVIASFGPLRITQGSLLAGIEKAVTLEGLIMLSRACVKSDLRLPGSIGSLLGTSLRILELMRERKNVIKRGHIVAGIDSMLSELETADIDSQADTSAVKPNEKALVILCVMVWFTVMINFIPPFSLAR